MTLAAPRGSNEWREPPAGRGVLAMELIRSFCGRLRALAVTLDSETARLQRALDGEDSGERGRGRARGEDRLSASGGPEGRGARDGWSPGRVLIGDML